MHAKPRPQTLDFKERMNNFKMASITVKTLQDLQREKAEGAKDEQMSSEEQAKVVEEVKVDRSKVNAEKKRELEALRKELLKRMLAEQKTFRERRGSQTSQEEEESARSMSALGGHRASQGEESERSKSMKSPPLSSTKPAVSTRTHLTALHDHCGNTTAEVRVQRTKMKENAKERTRRGQDSTDERNVKHQDITKEWNMKHQGNVEERNMKYQKNAQERNLKRISGRIRLDQKVCDAFVFTTCKFSPTKISNSHTAILMTEISTTF